MIDQSTLSPRDSEAERAVLAAVLLDAGCLDDLDTVVSATDFSSSANADIYAAARVLRGRGEVVDPLTIGAALGPAKLSDVGGYAYLTSLTDGVARGANVATHAEIVRMHARARQAKHLLQRTIAHLDRDPGAIANGLPSSFALSWEHLTLAGTASESAPLRSDVEILTMPEPSYLVDGVLPDHSLACLYGEPGTCKTFLSTALSFSVGCGRPWFGARIGQRGPAIYVITEGAAAMRDRVAAWKIAHEIGLDDPAGVLYWDGAVPLLDAAAVARFIAAVKPQAPRLVVLDTYARCLVGGDENSAKDTGIAIAAADRIRTALGATVLLVHHVSKSGAAERGSTALRGACDTMLAVTRTDDIIRVECSKQKDAEAFQPFELRLVPAYPGARSCVLRPAHEVRSDDLTDSQSKVLHVMRELFKDTGATSTELEQALVDMSRATYFRARAVLVERGILEERAKRWYLREPVSRSLTPVSRDGDQQSRGVSS